MASKPDLVEKGMDALALVAWVLGVLAALGIWVYQIVAWLRLGYYVHMSAKTEWPNFAASAQVEGWAGLNRIVSWFLDLNGGLQFIASAAVLAWGLYSLPRLKASS